MDDRVDYVEGAGSKHLPSLRTCSYAAFTYSHGNQSPLQSPMDIEALLPLNVSSFIPNQILD